jgi:hypothetical protein
MKTINLILIFLLFFSGNTIERDINAIYITSPQPLIYPEFPEIPIYNRELFLKNLGYRESKNDYKIVNKWGYLGKYQFSPKILKYLGYNVTKEEFLSNPPLQEKAMISLLKHNKHVMRRWIIKYSGKTIQGVEITESGILAATHLGGPKSVRQFLRGKNNKKDQLNTSISVYMELFKNYDLQL